MVKERGIKRTGWIIPAIFVMLFIFSMASISAVETLVCAEKTISGLWCQDVPQNQVNTAFRSAPTSCESTSFCRVGTCVDSQRGECRPSVPQRVCQGSGGVWNQSKSEDIPQCQLGCCLVGEQASFVTQTGCRGIAAQYGVSTNFRSDIRDFDQCLSLSNPSAKGACVIDDGFQRDCKLVTKAECNTLETSTYGNRTVQFSEGLLCTNENLATRCAPTEKTTCVDGKFGVYFLDSCGNVANIYDSAKLRDKPYWNTIVELGDSSICGSASTNGNAGSTTCGNCDYQAGSNCKPYKRGSVQTALKPVYGDYICADLSCTYQNKKYLHGEAWCANDAPGISESLPGSESYVLTCYNGEVTQTQCDSFRQSICREDVNSQGYRVAACIANEWRDCVDQKNKTSCEDAQNRDCMWVNGSALQILGLSDEEGVTYVLDEDGNLVPRTGSTGKIGAACVPRFAPGLNKSEAETACFAASEKCIVKFGRQNRFDDWSCKFNCQCLKKEWADGKINQCLALGDCGVKKNYIGEKGEDYDPFVQEGEHVTGFSQNPVNERKFVVKW